MKTSGTIDLEGGFKFIWMVREPGDEVYGLVEKPDGTTTMSGWYRTSDPEAAASLADSNLTLYRIR